MVTDRQRAFENVISTTHPRAPFYVEHRYEPYTELKPLQLALEVLREDLHAMERSPHLFLRIAAENSEPSNSDGLNTFVDQFAAAMKRSTSPDTGSAGERQLIETAPRDGRFLILEEDAGGKYDIARWAPEAAGWVREDGEPIKIRPSYWYQIEGENYLYEGLDISTSPCQSGLSGLRGAAAQRPFTSDIIPSRSEGAPPEAVAAVKTEFTAVGLKRSSHARIRFTAFLIAASIVVAACIGMYFRAEVASYLAPNAVRQVLFEISSIGGQVVGQASQWLSWKPGSQVSPAQISQGKNTQQVDVSARHIAGQGVAEGMEAKASNTRPANAATRLEPVAIPVEYGQASEEHDRGATLANESAMARRDLETKVALLSKVADEAAQFRQTADAAAAELRQSLLQESERVADLTRDLATARRDLETKVALSSKVVDEAAQVRQTADETAAELRRSLLQERERVADLTRDLATTRRDLETKVALSSKAGEEVEQLRQVSKAATAELEQQRSRSAELARDLESAQRAIGAHSSTKRPPGSHIDPMKQIAERAGAEPPGTIEQGEAARLMARASALLAQGSIGAARIVLDRAAETGSAEANFMLAETYDPIVLSKWGTYGTRGEATRARELYTKAQVGGVREARDRLDALRQ